MDYKSVDYESLDRTGLYLVSERPRIESVHPSEGKEGDIITLRGSGFSRYIRNNCIVVGGMGACARVQEGATNTELKARIDPVPRRSEGAVLVWVGSGANFYNESIGAGRSQLSFTETAIFRNNTPVAQAPVNFKLTEESKYAFGGDVIDGALEVANLAGHERGKALRVRFPAHFEIPRGSTVDICLILKEHPTIAVDFTAKVESQSLEETLRAIAKSVVVNGNHIGAPIFADVVGNESTNEFELYVTRPYLENALMTVHFGVS